MDFIWIAVNVIERNDLLSFADPIIKCNKIFSAVHDSLAIRAECHPLTLIMLQFGQREFGPVLAKLGSRRGIHGTLLATHSGLKNGFKPPPESPARRQRSAPAGPAACCTPSSNRRPSAASTC